MTMLSRLNEKGCDVMISELFDVIRQGFFSVMKLLWIVFVVYLSVRFGTFSYLQAKESFQKMNRKKEEEDGQ